MCKKTMCMCFSLHSRERLPHSLPILSRVSLPGRCLSGSQRSKSNSGAAPSRSEEHTSELQSRLHLVCRLLLEKKKKKQQKLRRKMKPKAPMRTQLRSNHCEESVDDVYLMRELEPQAVADNPGALNVLARAMHD